MRNLEAKFPLANHPTIQERAVAIGFEACGLLIQRDTFFVVAHGKLKLREQPDGAWLIHYRRDDQRDLQVSDYTIVPVGDPAALRTMFGDALGTLAEIRKERTLMKRRNVRLHLDRVEGLGAFGEIEAVMADGESPQAFHDEVSGILDELGVTPSDLIERSYFELLSKSIS
jgi:adenylate cyclase, class 2